MGLVLSSADLARLEQAISTLASPFDYEGVGGWRAASRHAIAALVGADKSGSLHPFDGEPPIQMEPEDMNAAEAYAAYYHRLDTGLLERRRALGLEVSHWSQVYDLRALVRSEIYNDWSKPSGLLDAMSMTIDIPGSPFPAGMVLYHARENAREFGDRGTALLRLLLPAFKAGVHHSLHFARTYAALERLIDQSSDSMIVVDSDGRVLYENGSAQRLLEGDVEAGRVRLAVIRLANALLARRDRRKPGPAATTTITPCTGEVRTARDRYVLRGAYLPRHLFHASSVACITMERTTPRRRSLDQIRRDFQLTRREGEVALLLAKGKQNEEIATALGVSRHTARHHTERVLAKLNVHTRSAVAAALQGEVR